MPWYISHFGKVCPVRLPMVTGYVCLNHRHSVCCQRSRLVGADRRGITHRLASIKMPHQVVVGHHFLQINLEYRYKQVLGNPRIYNFPPYLTQPLHKVKNYKQLIFTILTNMTNLMVFFREFLPILSRDSPKF